MKSKLLNIITLLTLVLTPATVLAPVAFAAGSCGSANTSKGQVLQGIGQTGSDCDDKPVKSAFASIVQILSFVVGAVAIIMIIVSGFRYITSGGDSAKVGTAKSALIYALVGIAVAALAQVLVHYIANQAEKIV